LLAICGCNVMSLESNLLLLREERFQIFYFATLYCALYCSSTIYYDIIWYNLLLISSGIIY
jgi:hypothetical protein